MSNTVATLPTPAHTAAPVGAPSTSPNQTLRVEGFDQAMRLADMMARGRLVPSHLQGQPADCLMVIEQSMRWGMSPFAVAQSTSVIQGKLMFEGKLVAGAVNGSGMLSKRLNYSYQGDAARRTVTVTGTLKGEEEPRSVSVMLGDAQTNNGQWKKQPDQMLGYHGARVWARRHLPEIMLGIYSPDEIDQSNQAGPARRPPEPQDITPSQTRTEALESLGGAPSMDLAAIREAIDAAQTRDALRRAVAPLKGADLSSADREALMTAYHDRAEDLQQNEAEQAGTVDDKAAVSGHGHPHAAGAGSAPPATSYETDADVDEYQGKHALTPADYLGA